MVSLEKKVISYGNETPDKVAIISKKERLSYLNLCKKITACVQKLKKIGINRQDIVILQAIVDTDYIVTYIALHILNAVVVPVDRKSTKDSICSIKQQVDAKYIIGDQKFKKTLENIILYDELIDENNQNIELLDNLMETSESDIYDVLYTTGTTGQSKGVITTRKSVSAAISNEIEGADMTNQEVLLIPIPLNHSFGLGKMRATLYIGGTIVLQNGVSMITELKNNLLNNHCTAMICVPSALEIIYRQAGDNIQDFMGQLHFIEAASAPFGTDLKQQMRKLLPNVHILNRYGSTETPASIYLDIKQAPDKLSSIGKPLSNVKVKIVDDDKEEIKSSKNNIGKLAITGPMVMRGYYNADVLTQSVLIDDWLYSKDLAYMDDDGYIFLMGRDDDVINTGGKKFSPLEVEELLMNSKLLKECAIVGIEDPTGLLGKVPVMAYVPINEDITEVLILQYLKEKIEKFKLPVSCIKIDQLPRNYMGKIERKKVKELF